MGGAHKRILEPEDKVAVAVIIPPEELKDDEPTLLQ